MISFDDEFGVAFIMNNCIEEDGWIFTYNPETHKFLIWENVEYQIEGANPYKEVDTLEQVLGTIRDFK